MGKKVVKKTKPKSAFEKKFGQSFKSFNEDPVVLWETKAWKTATGKKKK